MKKFFTVIASLFLIISLSSSVIVYANEKETEIAKNCKSAYLSDWNSGTEIYSKNSKERLPIASMCKIMTLLLCMDEIESGNLSLDDDIPVSENASGMGGSQVFLESGTTYKASDLIKSICIASANDSCVAMAEKIAGSEQLFVSKMNERAKSIGANDTLFSNCTGLPKPTQYSCAKDVALMLSALLKHEEYFSFSKIWMDKICHPSGRETELANTNKLIRFYNGCDAGKTGFTSEAGFCLAASAKRGNMRVVSVVIGGSDSKSRFAAVSSMFNFAFANCENKIAVDSEQILENKCEVICGKKNSASVKAERNSYVFINKNDKVDIVLDYQFQPIKAPVKIGDILGVVIVYKNGVEIDKVNLISNETIYKNSLWDAIGDIAENWNV